MSFTIIHDVEKDVAALVDAEFGRALGPIATGEKAVELLERFAGAHGVDPATIPTGELESRWKDFVTTLTGDIEDAAGEVVKVADEVLGGGHASAGDPGIVEPPANPVADPNPSPTAQVAAQVPADAPVPEGAASPGPEGERVLPVTSAKEGYAICPTCDGWGEVATGDGVGTCPTCKGLGEVQAGLEPTGDKPAA